jgi:hypothetical protein
MSMRSDACVTVEYGVLYLLLLCVWVGLRSRSVTASTRTVPAACLHCLFVLFQTSCLCLSYTML